MGQNLKSSINHYLQSEEIYTQYKFPERWKISQDTLRLVNTLFSEDFIGADLIKANLSGANLMRADLNGANLSNTIVIGTRFRYARGISDTLRKELKRRGAIFDDRPPVDSRSILSSRP